jgi:hypothetical protein
MDKADTATAAEMAIGLNLMMIVSSGRQLSIERSSGFGHPQGPS